MQRARTEAVAPGVFFRIVIGLYIYSMDIYLVGEFKFPSSTLFSFFPKHRFPDTIGAQF